ncbi:hypothetical protein TWF569_001450 [Orbilia oligospora]|uniref:Uncharacterized protein n=1 Tax=Orbilia oligospora TaxID=2813651 RepID=A0A7C8J695_ORBOL|nr:hypothetical protein TWF102_010109 [Orbilia oligospora]KAF3117500.1 hypothetical protein TWF103_006232 [Orbilia oligospora]KAF3153856.1 hypothetical protein TWF569_001450 [Orbilia oligospora]
MFILFLAKHASRTSIDTSSPISRDLLTLQALRRYHERDAHLIIDANLPVHSHVILGLAELDCRPRKSGAAGTPATPGPSYGNTTPQKAFNTRHILTTKRTSFSSRHGVHGHSALQAPTVHGAYIAYTTRLPERKW